MQMQIDAMKPAYDYVWEYDEYGNPIACEGIGDGDLVYYNGKTDTHGLFRVKYVEAYGADDGSYFPGYWLRSSGYVGEPDTNPLCVEPSELTLVCRSEVRP